MGQELNMDLEYHEVHPQYQYHVDLVPLHLNLKHVTNHHQKVVEEWLYLLVLWMVVDQTIDLIQTKHCTQ